MAEFELHGHCEPEWAELRDAFVANFDDGREIGASLCVMRAGEPVLDLWAGELFGVGESPWAGVLSGVDEGPWARDTRVPVYSTSKIPLVIGVLMLVDRGQLILDEPVARYWPEFAQGGKAHVTVREAITHRAGVPGLREPLPHFALLDRERVVERIAAEPHWFEGASLICYHLVLYGFLLGELIRRADGRMPRFFLNEELLTPIGADFSFGLPDTDRPRANGLRLTAPPPFEPDSVGDRVGASFQPPTSDDEAAAPLLDSDSLAANGWSNARGIARICALVAHGGRLDGQRLLSEAMMAEACREQAAGIDPMLGDIRWALGLGLDSPGYVCPHPDALHWGGYGGSWGVMHPPSGIAAGYAPNAGFEPDLMSAEGFDQDPRQLRLWRILRQLLDRAARGA